MLKKVAQTATTELQGVTVTFTTLVIYIVKKSNNLNQHI